MFTSMMAFFARVADPGFGGTYMTLLNTLANVGAKWPPSLALWGLGYLQGSGGDPLRLELLACTAAGGLWVVGFPAFIRRLEVTPRERWRPRAREPR
jgi:hypothetical protein